MSITLQGVAQREENNKSGGSLPKCIITMEGPAPIRENIETTVINIVDSEVDIVETKVESTIVESSNSFDQVLLQKMAYLLRTMVYEDYFVTLWSKLEIREKFKCPK